MRAGSFRKAALLGGATTLVGIVAPMFLVAPPAGAWKVPTCSALSAALVDGTLGPSPGVVKPSVMVVAGVKYLECDYGVYNIVSYIYGDGVASQRSAFASTEKADGVARVAGIGDGAFVQFYSDSLSANGKTTNYEVRELRVLDGPVWFTVSGLFTTFAKEEALARKIVPLF